YARSEPTLAAWIAARISGATPAALSLRSSITGPPCPVGRPPRSTVSLRWQGPRVREPAVHPAGQVVVVLDRLGRHPQPAVHRPATAHLERRGARLLEQSRRLRGLDPDHQAPLPARGD